MPKVLRETGLPTAQGFGVVQHPRGALRLADLRVDDGAPAEGVDQREGVAGHLARGHGLVEEGRRDPTFPSEKDGDPERREESASPVVGAGFLELERWSRGLGDPVDDMAVVAGERLDEIVRARQAADREFGRPSRAERA